MEKKRFKMYKKGKTWLVAPIVFFSILGATAFIDNNAAYAEEVKQDNSVLVAEQPAADITIEEPQDTNTDQLTEDQSASETTNSDSNETSTDQDQSQEESKEEQTDSSEDNSEETTESTEEDTKESNEGETTESEEQPSVVEDSSEDQTPKKETTEPTNNSNSVADTTVSTPKNNTVSAANATPKVETKAAPKATPAPAAAVSIPIYRVYNPNSGEHLHTMNSNERDYLVRLGWRYEGISMRVTNSGRQLFRVYNPNSGEHFYTLNASERDNLKKHGWRYEGVAWLTPWSGLPMYRVYNPNTRGAGAHHYTMLLSERNSLIKAGWRNEGISWYTLGSGTPIQLNFLGVNAQYIVNELNKHAGDKYYLGTPYRGLSVNDASQYMKPGSSMNCTGFVAKVIQNAGGNLAKITNISNNWGGLANAYNWRNALNPSVTSYSFNSVADLLKSGKASKGDIIYFEPNYSVTNYDCHIGFFWGNSSSDNKMWHSVPSTNRISSIYAPAGYSKVVVYKM